MATPFGSQPGDSAGYTHYRKLRWCWYQASTPRGRRPPPTRVRICLRGLRESSLPRGTPVRGQAFGFLRARRPWSSTPLVLSLNRAMCWLTWYLATMASALMLMYASRNPHPQPPHPNRRTRNCRTRNRRRTGSHRRRVGHRIRRAGRNRRTGRSAPRHRSRGTVPDPRRESSGPGPWPAGPRPLPGRSRRSGPSGPRSARSRSGPRRTSRSIPPGQRTLPARHWAGSGRCTYQCRWR